MFETKDTIAEWEKIYNFLKPLHVGDLVTYEQLTEVLGRDFKTARSPFIKANKELREREHRGLVNVRGVGYEVVTAEYHATMAKKHHRRGHRQLVKARHWIANADRTGMSPETVKRFEQMDLVLGRQIQNTRALEDRVARIEKAGDVLHTKHEDLQTQVQEQRHMITKIMENLKRLGYHSDQDEAGHG